jgi:hypothetical protein
MTDASIAAAGSGDALGHPPIDLFLDPCDTADGNGNGRRESAIQDVGVEGAAAKAGAGQNLLQPKEGRMLIVVVGCHRFFPYQIGLGGRSRSTADSNS